MARAKPKKSKKSVFPITVRSAPQIGNAIRRLRKLKKLSQIELAEKAGVTQATVSRIEKGHRKAEINTLLLIFLALEADLSIVEKQAITQDDSLEGLF